ncbi:DJ-1/PfpI family protein [Streptomyces gardneri]|uniref:GlxA family transcriptional regulator n=1 Tax=Nocardia TaxID=1817 RepID=UPI0013576F37|nr:MULTISPECIES: helix-turn-helix domain-containing protein [Nocardia]MBF6166101.1 DJ-1/PfpI family protein [Streptomyces gardneri]MBF6207076.1 DJ-1/PfpI family protein [Streptomyces gardneri]
MKASGDVVVAVSDGVLMLDVAGPVQVLHWAGHRVLFASPDGAPVRTDVGVPLGVDGALRELGGAVGTLLVPGYPPEDRVPAVLVDAVRAAAAAARQVASVCTGAFVLAEAGLLDGRRATTHWLACAALAQRFPLVRVDADAIYVRDGPIVTSAGVTAGIDMALALVEEEHGAELARSLARHLVVFLHRPGGQSQFSVRTSIPTPRTDSVRQVVDAVIADLCADHSLAAMAARAALSERHLSRLFRQEIGVTPGRYVKQARLEAARALLESGDEPMAAIARRSGFGSEETMRRTFLDLLGASPSDYRRRFRAPAR